MNSKPVIASLTIEKLFGAYDLSINFSKLTVIVGKNGLGKTTLLKIINALITGKFSIDYASFCKSIKMVLGDGHSVIFGEMNEGMIEPVTINGLAKSMVDTEKAKHLIKSFFIEKNIKFEIPDDAILVMFNELFNNDKFVNAIENKIINDYSKHKVIIADKSHLAEFNSKVLVRYISTVNISANADSKIDFGNSVEKNLLDIAISDELRLLIKTGNQTAIKAFRDALNDFLRDSEKNAELVDDEWIFKTTDGVSLTLGQLSSGERQLVYILATAASTVGKQTLFLMDEPEVSLHLSWQEKIIDAIMQINPQMQIIAVTHSPGIVMNGHMDAYIEMKDILKESVNV